jgi:hypothetical protein
MMNFSNSQDINKNKKKSLKSKCLSNNLFIKKETLLSMTLLKNKFNNNKKIKKNILTLNKIKWKIQI